MHEILPDVLTWQWFSEPHGYDFNGYLIRHADGNLCIDPVQPTDADLDEMSRLGAATILLTNRNHSRAANAVRARTHAVTRMNDDDAARAREHGTIIDGGLRAGERIGPLVVVAAPGKSPGEVALHWPERGILFVGDAVIGNPPGHCSLLREQVIDEPPLLRRSVRALLGLEFDALLLGDGAPIVHGAKARLAELVATFAD